MLNSFNASRNKQNRSSVVRPRPEFAVGSFVTLTLVALAFILAPVVSRAEERPPLPSTKSDPKLEQLLKHALNALRQGQMDEALVDLRLAVSIDPGNGQVRAWLGIALLKTGDYSKAEEQLRYARSRGAGDDLVLGPLFEAMLTLGENQALLDLFVEPAGSDRSASAATVLRARAAAQQALGDGAGAGRSINRSLAIRRDLGGLLAAAQIAIQQKQFGLVNDLANEALRLSPNNIDFLVLKIDAALFTKNQSGALAIAERLVADNPHSMTARLARINTYLATGNTDKAKSDVDLILAQAPTMLTAMYYRAIILARHNNFSAAWSVAHSLPTEFLQSSPEIAVNVAQIAAAAGFLDTGAQILAAAVAKNPNLFEARLQLAVFRLRQNSAQYALNVLAPVEDSKDPRVAILFAQAYLKGGHISDAQTYIDRAILQGGGDQLEALGTELALKSLRDWLGRNPNNVSVRRQYAILLLRSGDFAGAKAQYELIIAAQPMDALSLNNLAWLVRNDDPSRALKFAQLAVKQSPSSPDFLDTLGWLQLSQSDRRGALSSLQQAHRLRAADGQISYHLAVALDANGAHPAAKLLLRDAVAHGGFTDLDKAEHLLAAWR